MNEEKGFPVNPEPVNGYEERDRTDASHTGYRR